jgi:phage terminase large subunit
MMPTTHRYEANKRLLEAEMLRRAVERRGLSRTGGRVEVRMPYAPHGTTRRLWECTGVEVMLSGPAGTGKSRAVLEFLHEQLQSYPHSRALILRKVRASLTESGLVTFEEKVLGAFSPLVSGAGRGARQSYRYSNGSVLVVGGIDKATKIMSTEYDAIFVQEAIEITENEWELLITRLRNGIMPRQYIIGDTNPGSPMHWIKQRSNAGRMEMIQTRHEDNPTLWDEESGEWTDAGKRYIAKLDNLTGVRKQRLRYGLWVQAEGAVYEDWSGRHIIDPFAIPSDWRRFRVVDFGYTNPFVCQWWAIDPDGRMYRYREIYYSRRMVEDHAADIIRLSDGETIETTVCDHDAEGRATLERHGIPTVAAEKSVSDGIETVRERLRIAGDGKPRMMFFRGVLVEPDHDLREAKLPVCTEEEFDGYVYQTGSDGRPNKEQPVKTNDHGMDAVRYAAKYAAMPKRLFREW